MRFGIVLIPLFLIFSSVTNGISKDEEFLEPIPVISVAAVGDILMGITYPSGTGDGDRWESTLALQIYIT